MVSPESKSKKSQKGFAKAFKHDIGREKEIVEEKWEVLGGRSLLMNPVRQNIFKYLCAYPCSSLSNIAHDFNISVASMSWHLTLLLDRNLISDTKVGGQRLFFPQNMIEEMAVPVLALLTNPKILKIYILLRKNPGISQKELSKKLNLSHQSINSFTKRLDQEQLITIVRDGKFTRYYPSTKLNKLEITQRKHLKEFRNWIIKAFKFDGINPKLIRATDQLLFLQITSGKNVESIRLTVNPFYSVIQDKTKFLAKL